LLIEIRPNPPSANACFLNKNKMKKLAGKIHIVFHCHHHQ